MNKYNKPQKWRRLSSRVVFTHPRMILAEDEVELPDGKRSLYLRQVYQGKGGVIIICQNGGKVLIQREYSYPVDDILYQFPGGKIEEGETPEQAAQRELAEESNISVEDFQQIGTFRDNYSLQPDETEFISSDWLEINKLEQMISDGRIVNYAMLAAWVLFKLRR